MKKRNSIKLIILTIVVMTPQFLFAQIKWSNLEEVISYAKANQIDFDLWQEQKQHIQNINKLSQSSLLPQLKAYGNFDDYLSLPVQLIPAEIFGGTPGTFAEVQFGTQYQLNLGFEVSLPLINTTAWNNKKLSTLESTIGIYQLDSEEQDLLEKIARTYYLTLLTNEAQAISQENEKTANQLQQIALSKEENGLIYPLNLNRLKANYKKTQNDLEINKENFNQNLAHLKLLTGVSISDNISLLESLTNQNINLASETNYSVEKLPQMKKAAMQIMSAEQKMKLNQQSYLPELSAFGRYSQQAWSNNLELSNYDWFEVGLIGLRLEWKLFTGLKRRTEIKIAESQLNQAIGHHEKLKNRLSTEHAEMERKVISQEAIIRSTTETVNLYIDNLDLAKNHFKEGIIGTEELLQIQQELYSIQKEYLNQMADYYVNKAIIEIRSGKYK